MATTTKKSTTRKKPTSSKISSAKTTKKATSNKVVKAPITSKTKIELASVSSAKKDTSVKLPKTPLTKMQKLFKWNITLAGIHALQAVAIILLSKPGLGVQPVTTSYLTLDTLASTSEKPVLVSATRFLFNVNLAWFIAAFFIMSALAHLIIATRYRKTYEANLTKGMNKARWIEYSLSASTMMVAIGFLAGIFDLGTIIAMFALTAVMNLCGLIMEVSNQGKEKPNWLSYIVGCIAGIVPWIVFAIYIYGSRQFSEGGGPPSFVYWILLSIFLIFNSFAYVMYKQYTKKGKWADYLYGEKVYMILSLVAKTLLAWQVFSGALRP